MSSLRTFIQSLDTGQTNITRVLTLLMRNPAQWRDDTGEIGVNPLSTFVKTEFGRPGRMITNEITHIENQWPMDQKEALLEDVLTAIEVGRRMVFKWTLTSANEPATDVAWPPDNAPLDVPIHVTFRSPRAGVTYAQQFQGGDSEVTVEV